MNIVVIDNDTKQLDKIADTLQEACPGGSVSVFKDPMLAVKYIYNSDTDIVFSEIRTKPVSGFDVLKTLKRIKPELLVVLLSEDESDFGKAIELGARCCQKKPLNEICLKELLKEWEKDVN